MDLQWCSRCVLPSTRPHLVFENGVCSACRAKDEEAQVDWFARLHEWEALVEQTKKLGRSYDAVLPVSAGKDSLWQTKVCLDYGLRCLAFTWKPALRTEIGQYNLEVLKKLGVDHLDFTINPKLEQKMHRRSFEELGADSAMHLGVFASVQRYAYLLNIPLVVWSENSADLYAGVGNPLRGSEMSIRWMLELGSTHGQTAIDYLGKGITERDIGSYECPTQTMLDERGIRQIFLGYYLGWDAEEHRKVAKACGMRELEKPITGWYTYADLDDVAVSAHHALKMWKFGQNRTMDNLSLEIRSGRMTRKQAIEIIRQKADDTNYVALMQFLDFIGLTFREYYAIAERFRNRDIWYQDKSVWKVKNFIVPEPFNWSGWGQERW